LERFSYARPKKIEPWNWSSFCSVSPVSCLLAFRCKKHKTW
jgi:hypothetical protein